MSCDLLQQITHVIFDFDGILVDSERQYSAANAKCLEQYGKEFTNEMKIAQMGRKKPEAVEVLLKLTGLIDQVDKDKYLKEYEELLDDLIPKSQELPGAEKLVNYFHGLGLPLAICTGSDHEEFQLKTKNFGSGHWLEKFPSIVLSGSDPEIRYGKPHPEPYLVTMKRFATPALSPKNVLVFEDSINGVKSALAAGMTVIMVPQEEFMPPDTWKKIKKELEAEVAEILVSLEEFNPAKYGLPQY